MRNQPEFAIFCRMQVSTLLTHFSQEFIGGIPGWRGFDVSPTKRGSLFGGRVLFSIGTNRAAAPPYEQVYGGDFEEIRSRVPDLSRIRTTVDYRPRFDLDRIIRDVIQWKRRNGHGSVVPPRKTLVPKPANLETMLALAFPS